MKKTEEVVLLPLSKVTNSPLNPRLAKNPRYETILESIRSKGENETPIVVYPNPEKKGSYYTLAGGGTRLDVLHRLGIKNVRCIISNIKPDDATVIAHHLNENSARGDTSFADTAKAVNKLVLEMPQEKGAMPQIDEIQKFLADKGVSISRTSISLYLKTNLLFEGWHFYPYLSKRIVSKASTTWGNLKKGIQEYDTRVTSKVLRGRIIAPAIDIRNENSLERLKSMNPGDISYGDNSATEAANMTMEVHLLFSEMTKICGKFYGEKTAKKNDGINTDEAVSVAQEVMRRALVTNNRDTNVDTGATEEQIPQQRQSIRESVETRRGINNTLAEQQKHENQAAKEQNKENNRRIHIVRNYRDQLKNIMDQTEAEIRKKKGNITITISRDLCADIYSALIPPAVYIGGEDQADFFQNGHGRFHRAVVNKEINLEELLLQAQSEVDSRADNRVSNVTKESAS